MAAVNQNDLALKFVNETLFTPKGLEIMFNTVRTNLIERINTKKIFTTNINI